MTTVKGEILKALLDIKENVEGLRHQFSNTTDIFESRLKSLETKLEDIRLKVLQLT